MTDESSAQADAASPIASVVLEKAQIDAALERARFAPDGLLPAVVQEESTRDVLMLGYMNAEALRRTLDGGRVTYWSRSRQEFWRKGDTSGHAQYVRAVAFDCDSDALLVTVHQVGPACHTGAHSCFDVGPIADAADSAHDARGGTDGHD